MLSKQQNRYMHVVRLVDNSSIHTTITATAFLFTSQFTKTTAKTAETFCPWMLLVISTSVYAINDANSIPVLNLIYFVEGEGEIDARLLNTK